MESKLAQRAREDLIAAAQSLTPEQRLQAFLRHCRLMMKLYFAGRQFRGEADRIRP